MSEKHIRDVFEEKARKGDAGFAIAYALLELATAQANTSRAIHKLGLADAATPFGAIEHMSSELKNISVSLDGIATAVAEALTSHDEI